MSTNPHVELPFDLLIMNYLWQYPYETDLEGLAEDIGVTDVKELKPAIRRLTRQGLVQQIIRIDNVGKWEGITLDSRLKDRHLLAVRREAKTLDDETDNTLDQLDENDMGLVVESSDGSAYKPDDLIETYDGTLVDPATGEVVGDEPEIEDDSEAETLGGTAVNLRVTGLPELIDPLIPALTPFQDILFPYHLRFVDNRSDLVQVTHTDPDSFAGHYIHNGEAVIARWRELHPDAHPWQPFNPETGEGLPPVWPVPDKHIRAAREWGKWVAANDYYTLEDDWTEQLTGGHVAALEAYIGKYFWDAHQIMLSVLQLRRMSLTIIERRDHPEIIKRNHVDVMTGRKVPPNEWVVRIGGWYKWTEITPDTDFVTKVQRPFDYSLNGVYTRLREHLPDYMTAEPNLNTSNPDGATLAVANSTPA